MDKYAIFRVNPKCESDYYPELAIVKLTEEMKRKIKERAGLCKKMKDQDSDSEFHQLTYMEQTVRFLKDLHEFDEFDVFLDVIFDEGWTLLETLPRWLEVAIKLDKHTYHVSMPCVNFWGERVYWDAGCKGGGLQFETIFVDHSLLI